VYTYISGTWVFTGDSSSGTGATVFYQDTEPTSGDSPVEGDLWVDTSDDNTLYVYHADSPSSWIL